MKIYAAYGSNMNLEQMAVRCPNAVVLGRAFLHNYQLCFRGNMGSGVATVIPQKGRRVPIVMWGITEECEKSLDRYEGFPTLYHKENLIFSVLSWNSDHLTPPVDGMVEAMIYLTKCDFQRLPSLAYFSCILVGYRDAGFHRRYLDPVLKK